VVFAMPRLTVQQAFDLAMRHHQAGRLSQAEQLYTQILAHQPGHADAANNLGLMALQAGRIDVAVDRLGRAIALRPGWAEAYSNLGSALSKAERLDEAIAACQQALAIKPNLPGACNNLAMVLQRAGRHDEAIDACRRAIALDPGCIEAHNGLGLALNHLGRFDEAMSACRHAITVRPDFADAHLNLGDALQGKGELEEAVAAYRRAIALRPDLYEAYSNLGIALRDLGQLDEAMAACRQAVALKPDLPDAHCNIGIVLHDQGQLDQAIAAYRRSIALNPNSPDAHFSLALALLAQGDFRQGWEEHEWRWESKRLGPRRDFAQPQWDGLPLAGRTLLLHAEQGLGDTLQFIRYLPLAARCGGRVIVECQSELLRLLRTMAPDCEVVGRGQALPPFDVHCPLLSLPKVFGTTLGDVPNAVPYLGPDAVDAGIWRQLLDGPAQALKVGLVWAGSPGHKNDRNRSMNLTTLAPLGKVPGIQFFSLQKGEPAAQARAMPAGLELIDWTHELKDFADTAALIANLDLVIAVDTAVAHLAGAMGKPVWVLLPFVPDWRWMQKREDSPWYPTMRLFRQPSLGDWDSLIERVAGELSVWASQPFSPPSLRTDARGHQ